MHNSSSHTWHEAFASVDFSVQKQVLSSFTFGCAGLFALALSASHFMFQTSAAHDLPLAYAASQPEAGASPQAAAVITPHSEGACAKVQSASAERDLANHPDTRKQLVAHVEGTYKVPAPLAQNIVNTTITVSR